MKTDFPQVVCFCAVAAFVFLALMLYSLTAIIYILRWYIIFLYANNKQLHIYSWYLVQLCCGVFTANKPQYKCFGFWNNYMNVDESRKCISQVQ